MTTNNTTELGSFVKKEARKPGVVKLLEALKEKDELFNYNVPATILNEYNDTDLISHLDKIYSKPEFAFDDPELISRFIKVGSRVVKKGALENRVTLLEVRTQGRIFEEEFGRELYFAKDFYSPRFRLDTPKNRKKYLNSNLIHPAQFTVTGKKGAFRTKKIDPIKLNEYGEVEKNLFVFYTGKPVTQVTTSIPDKSKGLVMGMYRRTDEHQLSIVWEENPGVVNGINSNTRNYTLNSCSSNTRLQPKDIQLIKPNNTNYAHLKKECLGLDQ
ncbi:hypothetical protein HOK51_05680 [Candidatus Woesearchaeota archaeon]|jgi:hypothetical protein|nr:hypothetical protein [Candidatus Woesearchaeota archaeon]MBT6519319.1 hypothetical protein [Candidatus Woesearchaeota archaeon]MBT7368972.1 hypothetical protein [Candidatus Woesearchaeota archaeon]